MNHTGTILLVTPRTELLQAEVLATRGYQVTQCDGFEQAHACLKERSFDLILVSWEDTEHTVAFCDEVKTQYPGQRLALMAQVYADVPTDCPEDVVRLNFDPKSFVGKVSQLIASPAGI